MNHDTESAIRAAQMHRIPGEGYLPREQACTADACGHNPSACPTKQACQVPDHSETEDLAEWYADMKEAGKTLLVWGGLFLVGAFIASLWFGW